MAGYLQSISNAQNQITTFEYDAVGRVTKQTLPDNRIIHYSYDANGNLLSLTPPGRPAHVYQYSGMDQATQYTPPLLTGITTQQTVYAYDRDEELTSITRPDGQIISFNYGLTTGKLDSMTIPTGNYSYSYHPSSGQLSSITAPDLGIISYTYDGFLPINTNWAGTITGSITSSYDNDFRITQRSINGAHTINHQYGDDNLLTMAGSLSISREAQKASIISATTLDSLTTSRSYNGFAELSSFDASYTTSSLFSTSYSRDKLGRITQKVETIAGITISYSYDSNGNRTHINGALVGHYDDQDRLTSYAGATFTYTANGELLSKTEGTNTTQYQYDVLGNLRQATLADGTVVDYVIDGQDRRIGKKVNVL